ncbi:thioredoxin family protein [Simkania negevensis]|uniref:Thioredoxin family protein n=1 Tax=Simkania negevensis TaxID=83561 RepID=A0ABS3ARE6_9BACT|nr:thioredoxin family protein [Simkania negevensis]
MSLRDRIFELRTPEEVDEFFATYPTCVIFKAGSCHKTMQGFGYVEDVLQPYRDLHMGFIRVVESRPASNQITNKTVVKHESPQFILIVDAKVVYDVDNWDITPDVLQAALTQHIGEASSKEAAVSDQAVASDITSYLDLLEQYLTAGMSDAEFEKQWLLTFQMDSTPRSTNEFELLNSLYGDVDAAIESTVLAGASSKLSLAGGGAPRAVSSLKARATTLYDQLQRLSS